MTFELKFHLTGITYEFYGGILYEIKIYNTYLLKITYHFNTQFTSNLYYFCVLSIIKYTVATNVNTDKETNQ